MFFNKRIPSWIRGTYYHDSLGGITFGIFFGMTTAFFPIIARKIGSSDIQLAMITSFPFVGALLAVFWAHYSSERQKMHVVVTLRAISVSVLFFMLVAHNAEIFVALIFLYWIFEMASVPAYSGIMQDIYPEKHRGKAMGYVRVEMALAALGTTYLAGILLDRITFRYVFPIGAIFGLASLFFFSRIKVESDKTVSRKRKTFSMRTVFSPLGRDKAFLSYMIIFFIFGFGNLIPLPLYIMFLVDELHTSNEMVGKITALYSFFWLFSYMFWGEYIDRSNPLKGMSSQIIIASFVPLCYYFARDFTLVAVASSLSGVTFGGMELARMAYLAKIATQEEIQKYQGIDFTLMGIRGLIAPFIGIALMKLLGIRIVFFIAFVMSLTSGLLMLLFYRRETKVKQRPDSA